MHSAVALASPARTSSTICATVKPCASMIASCSRRETRRAIQARGGGRALGRVEGRRSGAWSSGGGGGLGRQDNMSRPRGHALDRAIGKLRGGRRAHGGAWQQTPKGEGGGPRAITGMLRPGRQLGEFPKEPVARLRAGRQCKPLWPKEMG